MAAASTLLGGVYLLLLFGLCLAAVAGAKAIRLLHRAKGGAKRAEKRRDGPPPADAGKAPKSPAPPAHGQPRTVYYLVEKKRTLPKTGCKPPRAIAFADKDEQKNG